MPAVEERPARRSPAPGSLALVQRFLNTHDIEALSDGLATPDGVRAWLASVEMPAVEVDEADRRRLVRVREALRDLIDAATWGDPVDPAALEVLGEAAEAAPLRAIVTGDGGVRLAPRAAGADEVVGRLLAAIASAHADGTWRRLKVCRNDACRWSFYDASRNRSGHWCSMAVCGNRMKGRAFRRRRRPGTGRPRDDSPT